MQGKKVRNRSSRNRRTHPRQPVHPIDKLKVGRGHVKYLRMQDGSEPDCRIGRLPSPVNDIFGRLQDVLFWRGSPVNMFSASWLAGRLYAGIGVGEIDLFGFPGAVIAVLANPEFAPCQVDEPGKPRGPVGPRVRERLVAAGEHSKVDLVARGAMEAFLGRELHEKELDLSSPRVIEYGWHPRVKIPSYICTRVRMHARSGRPEVKYGLKVADGIRPYFGFPEEIVRHARERGVDEVAISEVVLEFVRQVGGREVNPQFTTPTDKVLRRKKPGPRPTVALARYA